MAHVVFFAPNTPVQAWDLAVITPSPEGRSIILRGALIEGTGKKIEAKHSNVWAGVLIVGNNILV